YISARMQVAPYYPDVWPGEHYRLLAAIVSIVKPKLVIEIGTATGLSALTIKKHLAADAMLATFDIQPWRSFSSSVLKEADFQDNRLVQYTDDLRSPESMRRHGEMIARAEVIFLDAAKDGSGEYAFVRNLQMLSFSKPPLLIFDDIRLWNMLKFWREIRAPKLDMT